MKTNAPKRKIFDAVDMITADAPQGGDRKRPPEPAGGQDKAVLRSSLPSV